MSVGIGRKGDKSEGEYINNLCYAADIVLIAKNAIELGEMMEDLLSKCGEAGVRINYQYENDKNIGKYGKTCDYISLLGLSIPTEFVLSDSSKTVLWASCKLRIES